MVEVVRDIWRSFGPRSLLKQGHLEQIAQNHVQMAFQCLQGWRFHILSGQAFPVLQCSVTLIEKRVFLMLWQNLLYFRLCSLLLILPLSTTEKNLALPSLHPPFRYYIHWWDPLWAFLLWSEQSQLCQPFLIREML